VGVSRVGFREKNAFALDCAEPPLRLGASFVGRQAFVDQLLRPKLEMQADLVVGLLSRISFAGDAKLTTDARPDFRSAHESSLIPCRASR
jgi:hypothetical protein